MSALLQIEAVRRRFGNHAAVDGVSFAVPDGAIVGLIGPNGAGKTTLFDLVAGRLRPDEGRIVLGGARIDRLAAERRLAHGLARTFQIPRPFRAMTVLENLLVGAKGQSGERFWANWLRPGRVAVEEREAVNRAERLLDFVTLAPLAHSPASVLSGGQRKLLELARALMAGPRLLLLDEPAAGVAPQLLETIIERVRRLNQCGMTVLVIEHHLPLIERLCGTVHVMAAGRLLASGTPRSVTADRRVREAYLGDAA